ADPDVSFGVRPHFPRNRVFHRDVKLINLARDRVDSTHLVHGVLGEPDHAITRYRHPIRISGPSRLDPRRNVKERKLPGLRIQANTLVAADGIKPNGSIGVDTHGISAGVASLCFWQLKDAEFSSPRVIA